MQNTLVNVSNGRLEPELVLFLGVGVGVGVGVWVGVGVGVGIGVGVVVGVLLIFVAVHRCFCLFLIQFIDIQVARMPRLKQRSIYNR